MGELFPNLNLLHCEKEPSGALTFGLLLQPYHGCWYTWMYACLFCDSQGSTLDDRVKGGFYLKGFMLLSQSVDWQELLDY